MKEKISLAGDLGSGKSTVTEILIKSLGAERYSTGALVREIAKKHGMPVDEFNIYMETHPETDAEIDNGLAELSKDERFLIIDSRMAWHFTKGTFKVYLSVDMETSALRIMNAGRAEELSGSLDEAIEKTEKRAESENKRYFEKYGVNIRDLTNYSLVVDTSHATPEEVASCIESTFELWKENKEGVWAFITPERLNYPDTDPDQGAVAALAASLEAGENIPEVVITQEGNELYLVSGLESALAYSFNMSTFIPVRILKCDKGEGDYIKMKNSL